MPRMIELIRQSAVPSNVMWTAARGGLSVTPVETIEILVELSRHPIFGEQARMTLAGWDEVACLSAAADAHTPSAVLEYWLAHQNRRPALMPALIENAAVAEKHLLGMAAEPSREIIGFLVESERVRRSLAVLRVLLTNPHLQDSEANQLRSLLPVEKDAADQAPSQYEIEHAAEIAAEEGKPFQMVGDPEEAQPAPLAMAAAAGAGQVDAKTLAMRQAEAASRERVSVIQKLQRMSVAERVQCAMKGSKDERFILIRDGSKVVSSAVLESPKISDAEIETFAAMKNVQESVLRGIAMKRQFMKNYTVVRALSNNPRLPLDVGLTIIKQLLTTDLKNLSMNKNVSETLRKAAARLIQQRNVTPGGK